MDDRPSIANPIRWLQSILIWYIFLLILYLIVRFFVPTEWRFIAFINNFAPYLFLPVIIGLLISLLMRAQRLIGVYLLVCLVGALWIGPPLLAPFLNPPAAEADATTIDIISFNIAPNNPTLDAAADWVLAFEPDILALQDIPLDNDTLYGRFSAAYPYHDRQNIQGGGMFFSQYPILESSAVDLTGRPMNRYLLDINGNTIALYNVHLVLPLNDNEDLWLPLRYDDQNRNQQVRELLEIVEAETVPVILVGDFNLTEWSPMYHRVAGQLTDAYRASSWGTGATWPVGDNNAMLQGAYPRLLRLDYVWYSDPLIATSATVGAPLGSDHLPLLVELSLP